MLFQCRAERDANHNPAKNLFANFRCPFSALPRPNARLCIAPLHTSREHFAERHTSRAHHRLVMETPHSQPENVAHSPIHTAPPRKTSAASAARRQWHLAVVPDDLDRLRDHPDFDVHGDRAALDLSGTVLPAHALTEGDREALYHLELLRIFRQRLRFAAAIAMFMAPLFAYVDTKLLPATQREVVLTYFLLFGVALVTRMVSWRLATLWHARFLSLLAYTLYAVGSGVIVALMDQNPFQNQFLIYYSHNYLMMSALLLPSPPPLLSPF